MSRTCTPGPPNRPANRKTGGEGEMKLRWWWVMGGESKRKNTEEGGEAVRTGACSQKGQADCLGPNMLAFSKLTWQRRYFPWSRRRESKMRPRREARGEIHFGYQQTAAPLLHAADIFSNYVINTVAGLISEMVHYNCVPSFIR